VRDPRDRLAGHARLPGHVRHRRSTTWGCSRHECLLRSVLDMFTSTRYPSAVHVDVNISPGPVPGRTTDRRDDDVHSGTARPGAGPPGADGPPAAAQMAGMALRRPVHAGVRADL